MGEIRLLDTANVNLKDYSLKVTERNNQARTIPLPDGIAASLELWLVVRALHVNESEALFVSLHHSKGRGERGKRLSIRGIRSIIDKKLEDIGAKKEGVSCNAIRRSGICHTLLEGADLQGICSMYGLTLSTYRASQQYVKRIRGMDL